MGSKEINAKWRANNPERAKQLDREKAQRYREKHRDQILAGRKAAYVRGTERPHLSDEEKHVIEQFYQQGLSFKEISAKVMRTGNTVANYLRTQHEIRVRPVPRGPKHQAWKGGRFKDKFGYWLIRLMPQETFFEMCSKDGLVPEHRLVMARILGRSLLPTETVHHINGARADNRPENLQLRQGNHGKGIVLACLDCGSHRIGPVTISTHTED